LDAPRNPIGPGYRFGDIVYLRCRDERIRGMVTLIQHFPSGAKTYGITWGDSGQQSVHYAFELDSEFTPDLDLESD
jgi:hypothetical protein